MQLGNATILLGFATMHLGYATIFLGYATMHLGNATIFLGNATMHLGYATIFLGNATMQLGNASIFPGFATMHRGYATIFSGYATMHLVYATIFLGFAHATLCQNQDLRDLWICRIHAPGPRSVWRKTNITLYLYLQTTVAMEVIKINVNKQMDGYAFSIAPSIRNLIKSWYPDAHPANNIFVTYDTKSDFELYYGKLERFIYPALLGIDNAGDLNKKVDEILFIDTQTGNILHSHKLTA